MIIHSFLYIFWHMKYCDIGKLYEILVHTPGTLNTCSLINPTNHLYSRNSGFIFYTFVYWFMYSKESGYITLSIYKSLVRTYFREISYALLGCLCKKRFESWRGGWHGNSDWCSRNCNWWVLRHVQQSERSQVLAKISCTHNTTFGEQSPALALLNTPQNTFPKSTV